MRCHDNGAAFPPVTAARFRRLSMGARVRALRHHVGPVIVSELAALEKEGMPAEAVGLQDILEAYAYRLAPAPREGWDTRDTHMRYKGKKGDFCGRVTLDQYFASLAEVNRTAGVSVLHDFIANRGCEARVSWPLANESSPQTDAGSMSGERLQHLKECQRWLRWGPPGPPGNCEAEGSKNKPLRLRWCNHFANRYAHLLRIAGKDAEDYFDCGIAEFDKRYWQPDASDSWLGRSTIFAWLECIGRWKLIDKLRRNGHVIWLAADAAVDRPSWNGSSDDGPPAARKRLERWICWQRASKLPPPGLLRSAFGEDCLPAFLRACVKAQLYACYWHLWGVEGLTTQSSIAAECGVNRTAVHLSLHKSWERRILPWVANQLNRYEHVD